MFFPSTAGYITPKMKEMISICRHVLDGPLNLLTSENCNSALNMSHRSFADNFANYFCLLAIPITRYLFMHPQVGYHKQQFPMVTSSFHFQFFLLESNMKRRKIVLNKRFIFSNLLLFFNEFLHIILLLTGIILYCST